jgi:Grx4 family monothiol glutaredoxin
MSGINEFIDNEVKSNEVVLFMKGTPDFPQCGFSGRVVQILEYVGVDYKGHNVLADADLRQGIKDYSSWPNHSAALCEGRIRRRLRYHHRDVPGRRTPAVPDREGCGNAGRSRLIHQVIADVFEGPGNRP